MIRATSVQPSATWSAEPLDVVVLDFDARHRRRVVMRGVRGTAFLLDLAEATALRGGDALVLDDGGLIEVVAAPEPLAEVGAPEAVMLRIAWHLGNRHLPVQLAGRRLRIRRDHVIEAMIERLGGRVVAIEAPFDPEGGAYAEGGAAAHGHAHGHGGHHHHHE